MNAPPVFAHSILVVAALLSALAAGGCASFPTETKPERLINEESRTQTTGMPDYAVRAVVARDEADAIVHFELKGRFTNVVTRVSIYERDSSGLVSVGLFPGVEAKHPEWALAAVWYNILFLGTPTLSGLLLEPFREPHAEPGSVRAGQGWFRRSALVGFCKWKTGGTGTQQRTSEKTLKPEIQNRIILPVGPDWDDIRLTWTGLPSGLAWPEFGEDLDGAFARLRGVYGADGRGPSPISVRLEVPEGHRLKELLCEDVDQDIPVEL